MRARGHGRILHIASQAGVSLTPITGPSYMAAKHAVVALSRSLNAEEGIHGIRSTCLSPGEVETPILNTRPVPPTAEERALMLQPEDVAEVALFCATLPRRACQLPPKWADIGPPTYIPINDRLEEPFPCWHKSTISCDSPFS
jgi:NAD(P)-dependent dehydrogenase (short-subunit alcohol dehydrogenase family)